MLKALRWKAVPRWLMVTSGVTCAFCEFTPHEVGVVSLGGQSEACPPFKTSSTIDGGDAALCPPNALRTDLLCAQPQSRCATATNQHDGKSLRIFRNRVKPRNQKYSA